MKWPCLPQLKHPVNLPLAGELLSVTEDHPPGDRSGVPRVRPGVNLSRPSPLGPDPDRPPDGRYSGTLCRLNKPVIVLDRSMMVVTMESTLAAKDVNCDSKAATLEPKARLRAAVWGAVTSRKPGSVSVSATDSCLTSFLGMGFWLVDRLSRGATGVEVPGVSPDTRGGARDAADSEYPGLTDGSPATREYLPDVQSVCLCGGKEEVRFSGDSCPCIASPCPG